MKNKNFKYKVLMIIVMISLFSCLLFGCGGKEAPVVTPAAESAVPEAKKEEPAVEPTAMPTNTFAFVEVVGGRIETPYGVLNYTEGLSDNLLVANTEAAPYTLEFYALLEDKPEVRLFDISLGEESGGNMGLAKTSQGEVPMNLTIYDISMDENWNEGELLTLQAMQDVVNELIEQLAPKKAESEAAAPVIAAQPEASVDSIFIETPLCTMYYPARWENFLKIVQDDSMEDVYKVHFYGVVEYMPEQLLFSIYFGGDEGEQLGAVMSEAGIPVPVNLIMAELDLSYWSQSDASIIYSMQEASNQLIEKLPLLP